MFWTEEDITNDAQCYLCHKPATSIITMPSVLGVGTCSVAVCAGRCRHETRVMAQRRADTASGADLFRGGAR